MPDDMVTGWHFICADHTTGQGNLKVEVGQTLTVEGRLILCKHGLHACRWLLDALEYAPGPVACKVEVWGDIIEEDDKLCGRNRKCLGMVDATSILHEFTCRCAERAMQRGLEAGRESHLDELTAAWVTARNTAWLAARDATRAATGDAASNAAWCGAWDAERDWQNAELERMLEEAIANVHSGHAMLHKWLRQ